MVYRNFSLLRCGEKNPVRPSSDSARRRAPKNISDIFVAEIFISRYNGILLLHPKKDLHVLHYWKSFLEKHPHIINKIFVEDLDNALKLKIKKYPLLYIINSISLQICNLLDRLLVAFHGRCYLDFVVSVHFQNCFFTT